MLASAFREGAELGDGRYILEHRLGSGGMATVWLALDTRLHRRVALKVPSDALSADETYRRRFQREARTAAAVSHPNLVPVYDYGCEGERPYLVSEFIDGESLARLRDQGDPPATEPLARALLAALGHIHSAGIVHRDVKPANVLVERLGRIMLTDFGIAQSNDMTALTAAGMVIGTQSYIAPEVRRGERAGPRADLYACGVLLGEQLSAEDRDSLHRLVERLTAPQPSERPASAEEALELFERGNSVVTATAPAEPPGGEPTAQMPRSRELSPPQPPPPPRPPRGPERVFDRGERRLPPPAPAAAEAEPPRSHRGLILGLLATAALAAVITALVLSGGDDGGGRNAKPGTEATTAQGARKENGGSTGKAAPTEATQPVETTSTPTAPPAVTSTTAVDPASTASAPDPVTAAQLNDEGYALLQQGNPAAALPKLEQSVALYPPDSTEIDYAYALFNYAQALRLTGNPAAAIPLLEKRLSFSDDQRETVEAELATAKAAAGQG